jgi:outer membrane lipoprotein-sorting protein
LLPALAVVAAFAAGTLAGAAGSPPPDPALDELIARYIEARGGIKKIQAVQSLRQKGHVTGPRGRRAIVTREIKRPGRIRFEFTFQGITAVFASNGTRTWKVSPFDGEMSPMPMPDEVQAEAADQADPEGPLVHWKEKGHALELVGREKLAGRDAYKLKLTLAGGAVRYEYLDAKTFQHVRSDSTREIRGRTVHLETTFADFKKTDGVLFPRRIEVGSAERPEKLKVDVEQIEVNPTLDDARFELPAATPD